MFPKSHLQRVNQLPGPKGLPVLSNLFQIDLRKLHAILDDWAGFYGDRYRFRLDNKAVVVVSDPALVQRILRDRPQTYRRLGSLERVARELGTHGVFSALPRRYVHKFIVSFQINILQFGRRYESKMIPRHFC